MIDRYLLKNIRPDEGVIGVIRTSLFHYRRPLVVFVLVVLAAFFLLYPLQSLGGWGWAIYGVMVLTGVVGLARTFLVWLLNVFILTNQRLVDIDQRKLFDRQVAECPLENIQDIRYNKKGLYATLLNFGTVVIDSASPQGHIELVDVPNPEDVKEMIMNVQHHHSKNDNGPQAI